MTAAPRRRSAAIDAVRVLGIAAVIFGHTYSGPLTHEFIYAWHVPLFFFLTGYLWSTRKSLDHEIKNRARRLGLPYVSWFAVLALLAVASMVMAGSVDLRALVMPALGGSHARGWFGTFWFVSALLFTAILYRLVCRLPSAAVWAIAGVGITLGYFFGSTLAATPLAIGSALPCLMFVVAGAAARHAERGIRQPLWTGTALIIAPLLMIAAIHPTTVDIKQGEYGVPVVGALFACAISFGLVLVAKTIPWPSMVGSAITELAVVGIAVVLFHPYVLGQVRAWGAPAPLVLVAAIVVPWVMATALHRTVLSPLFIGTERRMWRPRTSRPHSTHPAGGR